MKKILWSNEIDQKNKELVGNKAYNLSVLAKQGIRVPNYFVITSKSFSKSIPQKAIDILAKELALTNPKNILSKFAKFNDDISAVHHRILKTSFVNCLVKKIIDNYLKLGVEKVAIRSSANCEDGHDQSFAGQFESYLSVNRLHLLPTIRKCLAETFTEQVLIYCFTKKIDFSTVKMAVIVQEMISADKGGVIFTKDVFRNSRDIVVEAASGLGEQVVSGSTTSQKFILPRNGKLLFNINPQKSVLLKNELNKLLEIATKIEKIYNSPQDIEWAISKNKIYILQSRPLTG